MCRQGALEGKMKALFRTTLLLLVLLSSLGRPAHASAQTGTVVRVNPALVFLQAGQSATVEIRVENVEQLFGFAIDVHFDPSKISAASTTLGDFLEPGWTVENIIDNNNGFLKYAMAQIGAETPSKSGSGVLLTFEITLLKDVTETEIRIDDIVLTDRDSFKINCEVEDGLVKTPGYRELTFLPLVLH
jgi:hypothetical protein